MIQLTDIEKTYSGPNGDITILNGISLSIPPKASIAITGHPAVEKAHYYVFWQV